MEDKSIKIGTNVGSPIVTGSAKHVSAKVENSLNTQTENRSLAEAAAEIQQLLEQLSKTYSTDTTSGKMAIATEAIKHIESNRTLRQKIVSALKAGSVEALGQALNHPAASFVIGAFDDWQQ
jgi:phosphoenolpyruvate-protein kinase (PTS system EI component)